MLVGKWRWLAFIIGALCVLVPGYFFSYGNDNKKTIIKTETQTVIDSSAIRSLRDSIAMMRATRINISLHRETITDNAGNTRIVVDSGVVKIDTIYSTIVVHDTEFVSSGKKSKSKTQTATTSVNNHHITAYTYIDETREPGARIDIWIPLNQRVYGLAYADWQGTTPELENLEIGTSAKIYISNFFVQGKISDDDLSDPLKNFGWEIRTGVTF